MFSMSKFALPVCLVLVCAFLGSSLAGCMHERSMQIPADAMMATEGQRELQFRAQDRGTVYVYNRDDDRLVYSGDMNRGETLTVDTDHNRITIDGRTVLEKGLDQNQTRRVFFRSMRDHQMEEHRTNSD